MDSKLDPPSVAGPSSAVLVPTRSIEFDRFRIPSVSELKRASPPLPPSPAELARAETGGMEIVAASCELVGESGQRVLFSSLVEQRQTVVVVFLRHLWCGLCQQYVQALQRAKISPDGAPVYILLVSTGSPALIPVYRARLKCPLPLYVDPTRALYRALQMTKRTLDGGPEIGKGSYITGSRLSNVLDSISATMALRAYPGDQKQLGGEFVFSGKEGVITCAYVSRMSTTRNHSEVGPFDWTGVGAGEEADGVHGDS